MKIAIIIILITLILYMLITYLMFILISRKINENILPMTKYVEKSLEPFQDLIKIGEEWIQDKYNNKKIKDIYIKSRDGLRIHAILIDNKNSKGIFIETHGYRSDYSRDLYPSCHQYYKMGYSLLLIDHRACGKSEGKYITFGIKENIDLISWIKYINKLYPNKNIILAGVSLGASTILMSLKRIKTNMNIKCAIVDSPFISPYEEVLYCIKHYFHINGKIFIDMINLWCILLAKYSLKEENTISSLKRTNIPILFIHGKNDDFIPYKNSIINYKKYKGPKKIVLFDDATHGISYLVKPKEYIKLIESFISKYS